MPSLDGFRPGQTRPFGGFSANAARRYQTLVRALGRRLHVEVDGVERIPRGRALLVANHAFGWDVAFPMEAISRETGRDVWALGEHLWWKVPGLRRIAAAVGVVDGTRQNAEELLRADQLVVVLPGGLREAVKPRELRYQLLWGHRYGFVDVALRAGAPIVPLACVGADELFDFVGDAYARGRRWLHVAGIPIPFPSRVLPIPHRVALRYVIGEPILTEGVDQEDAGARRKLRREIAGALHELIEGELARRSGLSL
jgi:1-acyl-sn-glycerol-3-phosphate acyltransferase